MQYSNIGDNELLYLIRCDNQEAKECLIKRYQKRIFGIIDGFSKKYSIKGLDYEDYFQDCFIVFLKCIENYDENYNFFNYAHRAIERELYKLINEELLRRDIISIDDDNLYKDKVLVDVVSDSSIIYNEVELKNSFCDILDEKNKRILEYRLKGYSCVEIAKIMNSTPKSVYKRMAKIKSDLKEKVVYEK